jgi:hypothetical protein
MINKIIHICEDEKFINSAVQQFEDVFHGNNEFYIVTNSIEDEFIHVKPRSFVKKINIDDLINLSTSATDTIICLHSLSTNFYSFVLSLSDSNKILWFCFGFEVYNDSNYFKDKMLFDKETLNYFPSKNKPFLKSIKEIVRPYYKYINPTVGFSSQQTKIKVFEKLNFFVCPFREEYESITKLLKISKPLINFWYYPLEIIVDVNKSIKFPKKSILIGNSGHKTGNHLDVFCKIKNYSLLASDIVVPLNYGNSDYINIIIYEGESAFNASFNPLLNFIPLPKYNNILENVGVAIFNNKRQQAVGSTIALLWMGSKVFLSNSNPFYQYLKRTGIIVFCYETELNEKSCNLFLNLEQIEFNRRILFEHLNKEKLVYELKLQICSI